MSDIVHTKSPPLSTILSQFNPITILTTSFPNIDLKATLSSPDRAYRWKFSSRSPPPHQNSVLIPYLTHLSHILCPS
jgi:hypothetical protein